MPTAEDDMTEALGWIMGCGCLAVVLVIAAISTMVWFFFLR